MTSFAEHKILFTGTIGAGKTTAIGAISEIPPLRTDVQNHDPSVGKASTTVGLDYGEITLDGGEKLRLYGTPGQQRFDFMWKILGSGALGVVLLIDNSRPDPLGDLAVYLNGFADLIERTACVIGVGRMESHPLPDIDRFADALSVRGLACPVFAVDVRDPQQVLQLLDLLLVQLES